MNFTEFAPIQEEFGVILHIKYKISWCYYEWKENSVFQNMYTSLYIHVWYYSPQSHFMCVLCSLHKVS